MSDTAGGIDWEQRQRDEKCERIRGWMIHAGMSADTAEQLSDFQWLLVARQAGAAGKRGDRPPSEVSRKQVVRGLRGREERESRRSTRAS